jgi:hypothetical protein
MIKRIISWFKGLFGKKAAREAAEERLRQANERQKKTIVMQKLWFEDKVDEFVSTVKDIIGLDNMICGSIEKAQLREILTDDDIIGYIHDAEVMGQVAAATEAGAVVIQKQVIFDMVLQKFEYLKAKVFEVMDNFGVDITEEVIHEYKKTGTHPVSKAIDNAIGVAERRAELEQRLADNVITRKQRETTEKARRLIMSVISKIAIASVIFGVCFSLIQVGRSSVPVVKPQTVEIPIQVTTTDIVAFLDNASQDEVYDIIDGSDALKETIDKITSVATPGPDIDGSIVVDSGVKHIEKGIWNVDGDNIVAVRHWMVDSGNYDDVQLVQVDHQVNNMFQSGITTLTFINESRSLAFKVDIVHGGVYRIQTMDVTVD